MQTIRRQSGSYRVDYHMLVVIVAGLVISLPCLLYGFPFYGDDSPFTAVFYQEFSRLVWTGDPYPRWLEKLNGGLGSPTAYYYAPLTYWVTSLVKPLFRNDLEGWRQLGLSTCVAIVGSGVAGYLWLKSIAGRTGALVGSLTYLILPYHAAIDVYIRGAFAETWTFFWTPIVLLAAHRLITGRRCAFPMLALSYAALVLTHLPTVVVFSIIPLAYVLYVSPAGEKKRFLIRTIVAMALGVGVSAIYVLPALSMQKFMFQMTEGMGGRYYFANWFLFTGLRWSGRYSAYFFAAIGPMLLAILAWIVAINSLNENRRQAVFWFAIAVCSFAMMTPVSKYVWQFAPTLQKLQFPFRFNTALSLAVAALIALAFSHWRWQPRSITFAIIAVLLALSWIFTFARASYFAYPNHYVDQGVIDSVHRRLQQHRDDKEFRPRWVVSTEEKELDSLLARIGTSDGDLTKLRVTEGQAKTTIENWTARKVVFDSDSPTGAAINVSRFYFPGWSVRVDSSEWRATEPSKPGGLISLKVPPGLHRVELQLLKRRPEIAGQLISVISLLILLMLVVRGLKGKS